MNNINETVARETLPWHALRIQARLSSLAIEILGVKDYETFFPTYTSQRRWSDRVKSVNAPLFPGYLFCRFHRRDSLSVLMTPGVSSILGIGNHPVAIQDEEIEAVRSIVKSGLATEICPFLTVGTKIHLAHGPLAGLEGILTSTKKVDRLIVSVTLLHRSVSVEIDRAWARPLFDRAIARRMDACA